MNVAVSTSSFGGTVNAPPSKSGCHRSLICAALSDAHVTLKNCGDSDDIVATAEAISAFGGAVRFENGNAVIHPLGRDIGNASVFCRESGSTARFMLPIAAAIGVKYAVFTGSGRLPERPFEPIVSALSTGNVFCSSNRLPISVSGKLQCGDFSLPGNISSQYISGMLMALSVTQGTSRIILTTPLESAPYVDMTVEELKAFGADIEKDGSTYTIHGKASLTAVDRTAEGDWSQAAFFLAAGAVGGKVTVRSLTDKSLQGDRAIAKILEAFGADITEHNNSVTASKDELHGITLDASQIPDLVPIISVVGAVAKGTTVIKGAARLKLKESDRLKATCERLRAFGIDACETSDGLIIHGGKPTAATVTSAGDHRIAMAFAILASVCDGTSFISGFEAINKSYPSFLRDFESIGGNYNVITDR